MLVYLQKCSFTRRGVHCRTPCGQHTTTTCSLWIPRGGLWADGHPKDHGSAVEIRKEETEWPLWYWMAGMWRTNLAHVGDVILAKVLIRLQKFTVWGLFVTTVCPHHSWHGCEFIGVLQLPGQSVTSLAAVVPKPMQVETTGMQVRERTYFPFSLSRGIVWRTSQCTKAHCSSHS